MCSGEEVGAARLGRPCGKPGDQSGPSRRTSDAPPPPNTSSIAEVRVKQYRIFWPSVEHFDLSYRETTSDGSPLRIHRLHCSGARCMPRLPPQRSYSENAPVTTFEASRGSPGSAPGYRTGPLRGQKRPTPLLPFLKAPSGRDSAAQDAAERRPGNRGPSHRPLGRFVAIERGLDTILPESASDGTIATWNKP